MPWCHITTRKNPGTDGTVTKFEPLASPPPDGRPSLKTLADPAFQAEAEKIGLEIRYVSPAQVNAALAQALDAPEAIKQRALEELRKAGWEGLQ